VHDKGKDNKTLQVSFSHSGSNGSGKIFKGKNASTNNKKHFYPVFIKMPEHEINSATAGAALST